MAARDDTQRTSRRSLLKYALGTIGTLAAPLAAVADISTLAPRDYLIVDRRSLPGGGVGLFLRVSPDLSREALQTLGDKLRADFANHGDVIAEIFDDAEAARTVLTGSRIVGEERFAAARAHERAAYQKNAKMRREFFTILGPPVETIRY